MQLQPQIFQTRSKALGGFTSVGPGLSRILYTCTLVPQACEGDGSIAGHVVPQRDRVGMHQPLENSAPQKRYWVATRK